MYGLVGSEFVLYIVGEQYQIKDLSEVFRKVIINEMIDNPFVETKTSSLAEAFQYVENGMFRMQDRLIDMNRILNTTTLGVDQVQFSTLNH